MANFFSNIYLNLIVNRCNYEEGKNLLFQMTKKQIIKHVKIPWKLTKRNNAKYHFIIQLLGNICKCKKLIIIYLHHEEQLTIRWQKHCFAMIQYQNEFKIHFSVIRSAQLWKTIHILFLLVCFPHKSSLFLCFLAIAV